MQPNLIEHINKYVELNDEQVQLVLDNIKPITLKKKSYLLEEGQICSSLYFVEKGCLRFFFINDKGTEQITQFAIENWWIADYMSFDTQSPSQFYIQAIENTEVYAFDCHNQEKVFSQLPQLERYFRLVLHRAYSAAQLRMKYLYDFTKEESYQHFITRFPEFVQRIPQYMLASYLNLTPEYLSEIRKNIL